MPQISTIKPVETCTRAPGAKEREFLSRVDLKQGKVKVQIRTIIRQLAIHYDTENEEEKEYLTWNSDWWAKNYQGVQIYLRGHIEGSYIQQVKELATVYNHETDEHQSYYQRGAPRFAFNILFSPKKVEEILSGEHPLGPDSVNITHRNKVKFYGKFNGFRCHDYTYEQFVTPKWNDFVELAIRPGGPASRIAVKQKPSFIT
ncbi:MAG: hypothetical protein WB975_03635 [Nitrososphaeraceae archaeon]